MLEVDCLIGIILFTSSVILIPPKYCLALAVLRGSHNRHLKELKLTRLSNEAVPQHYIIVSILSFAFSKSSSIVGYWHVVDLYRSLKYLPHIPICWIINNLPHYRRLIPTFPSQSYHLEYYSFQNESIFVPKSTHSLVILWQRTLTTSLNSN